MALLERELSGLDELELTAPRPPSFASRAWSAAWPKLAAIAIFLALWQLVVWSGWKPEAVLPGPKAVFQQLFGHIGDYAEGAKLTLQRGLVGFALAVFIGTFIGGVVSRSDILRRAVGSMLTGLQTMPSIAWFPLAIVVFRLSAAAIFFVVILGAAPSVANGLLAGIDNIPPLLRRAGHVLGARGWKEFRYVVAPAAIPTYLAGLKQGWAFAWRSLMAGELLVLIPGKVSLGARLDAARQLFDVTDLMAVMIVIFAIGVAVDAVFGVVERRVRRNYGLVEEARVPRTPWR